jgi:IS5 family transposase
MQQLTLAHQADFQRYTKTTRREQFLEEMDAVMQWAELLALVGPYYSKGETGRKPVGLEIMLRVCFLQQWFALSDPAAEDALYESAVLRRFAGVDLGRAPAPTKNEQKQRDPAMHQTRKGNQWYFGMKAHIGVDSKEGIVHSVCTSAASVSDVSMLPDLLHGDEKKVWGDAGYQGQAEAIHAAAPHAQDMTSRHAKHKGGVDEVKRSKNRIKARVRSKVEWPFRVLKRVFGFVKVRFRSLKKNHEWPCAAFAAINVYHHRKRLARINQRLAPQGA